jgi:hypothetical protein
MQFVKKFWWALLVAAVFLYWQRIQIAESIYYMTGGKVSLFGVKGGSI